MMKKSLVGILMSVSVILAAQYTAAETIRMGYTHLPPHMYVNGADTPQGASVAYFEMVAAHMGDEVEWIGPLPLPRLISYLAKGYEALDGSIYFPKIDQMEQFLYYPDHAYYSMQSIFVITQENPLRQIRSIEDVQGYRVGLLAVPAATAFIEKNRDQLHLESLAGEEWGKQNLRKLLAHRLDAVYDLNQYTLPFEATRLQFDEQIRVLPLPEPPESLYVVFAKTSEKGKRLVERYNTAVQQMNLNYHELVEQEFDALTQTQ
jgi:ABC-type amino acid transport substrate-binding protein